MTRSPEPASRPYGTILEARMADLLASLVNHCQPPALKAEGIARPPCAWHLELAAQLVRDYKEAVAAVSHG